MKTFRAEIIFNGVMFDYMEFETDTFEMAVKYANQRFENAYPSLYNKYPEITVKELN